MRLSRTPLSTLTSQDSFVMPRRMVFADPAPAAPEVPSAVLTADDAWTRLSDEEKKKLRERVANENRPAANENVPQENVTAEGLSKEDRAQYDSWMQEELARTEGEPSGSITDVNVGNLEIMSTVSGFRNRYGAVLNGVPDQDQQIINRLVTHDIEAKVRDLYTKLDVASQKKSEKLQKKIGETTDEKKKEKLQSQLTQMEQDKKQAIADLVGERLYGRGTLGSQVDIAIRQSILPTSRQQPELGEFGQRVGIQARIDELDRQIRARPTSSQITIWRAEADGLREIISERDKSERKHRSELLLMKQTNTSQLNQTWGFVGATPESIDAWAGRVDAPEGAYLLQRLTRQNQIKNLLLPQEQFTDWLLSSSGLNPTDRFMLGQIYQSPEYETYRNLSQAVNERELQRWRETDDGKLMMSFLSEPANQIFLHGGATVPPGFENPITIEPSVLHELGLIDHTASLPGLQADLRRAELEHRALSRRLEYPRGSSIKDEYLRLERMMSDRHISVEQWRAIVDFYENHKAREIQQKWALAEAEQGNAQRKVAVAEAHLQAITKVKDADPKVVATAQKSFEDASTAHQRAMQNVHALKKEAGDFAIVCNGGGAPWINSLKSADFEASIQTNILNGLHITDTHDARRRLQNTVRRSDNDQLAFVRAKLAYEQLNADVQTKQTSIQKLRERIALIDAGKPDPEAPQKKKVSLAEMAERVRAKQFEARKAAERGSNTTASLSDVDRAACRQEARRYLNVQKATIKSVEGGDKVKRMMDESLGQKPTLRKAMNRAFDDTKARILGGARFVGAKNDNGERYAFMPVTKPLKLATRTVTGTLGGIHRFVTKHF